MNQTLMGPDAFFLIERNKAYFCDEGGSKLLAEQGNTFSQNFEWLIRSAATFHGKSVEIIDHDEEEQHKAEVEAQQM